MGKKGCKLCAKLGRGCHHHQDDAAPANRNRNRRENGQFRQGTSGNPSGRPKNDEERVHVAELAREYTGLALRVLVEVASDSEASPRARTAAANSLLDRGYGRPAQAIEHSGPDGADLPSTITVQLVRPESDE